MLTDEQIRQLAGRASYERGVDYYQRGRVKKVHPRGGGVFEAEVRGSQLYYVEVKVNRSGTVDNEFCDCPAFDEFSGDCKHIVAVLKVIQQDWDTYFTAVDSLQRKGGSAPDLYDDWSEEDWMLLSESEEVEPPAPRPAPIRSVGPVKKLPVVTEATRRMLSVFQTLPGISPPIPATTEATARLEPFYQYVRHPYSYREHESWLEFTVGYDRQYVLKDIPTFLRAFDNGSEISFGKNLVLRPALAAFDESSRQLIELLRRAYEEDQERLRVTYSYSAPASMFSDARRLRLTRFSQDEFFRLYMGHSIAAAFMNRTREFPKIQEGRPPIRLSVDAEGDGLCLDFDMPEDSFHALDHGLQYFRYGNTIYRVDSEFSKSLGPVLRCFDENRSRQIHLPATVVSDFVSHVLPALESINAVDIRKTVSDRLAREPLDKFIYLDRYDDGICARVEFRYGNTIIDPAMRGADLSTADNGKYLIRDTREEQSLLQLFRSHGFALVDGQLVLPNEDETYSFLRQGLPELAASAEVYYSDAFKAMQVKKSIRVKAGVRLNADNDLLEMSLDCEGMPPAELFELLAAYRLKKKYHRLGDGGFLSLDSPEFETAAKLIEQLGLTAADMAKPVIQLPKYRSLYIDGLARESGALSLERSSAFRQLIREVREPQESDELLPDGISGTLREYQKTGFKWLKSLARHGMGGVLADDMGLGKTLQVLTFLLSDRHDSRPSLVVAPTSLVYNWEEEAAKFTPGLQVKVVAGQPEERRIMIAEAAQADLIVTSYGLMKRDVQLYEALNLKYCFLDEAQNVKNPHTLNAKTVKRIRAGAYFALTGTPIENSLTELWSIFDFIMPGYFRSHSSFVSRFETPIVKNSDATALQELGRHIRPFVLRRMKQAVLTELPEKIESKMTAPMTEAQTKLYAAWLMTARHELEQEIGERGFDKSRIKILALLTRLRQICCHPSLFVENYDGGSGKLEMLQEIVGDAVAGGHRLLIFSQFTGMLEMIKPVLAEMGITYHYLDGSTPAQERIQLVNAFNRGEKNAFLISLKAGGTGLNLTGADMVVHYDPWWNPAVEDQATDRAYRIGQKKAVQVFKLVAKGTIEEKIHVLQEKKRELIDALIQPGESFLSKMTEAEIRGLFEG